MVKGWLFTPASGFGHGTASLRLCFLIQMTRIDTVLTLVDLDEVRRTWGIKSVRHSARHVSAQQTPAVGIFSIIVIILLTMGFSSSPLPWAVP